MGYHKRLQKLEAARLAVNRNLKGSTIAPSDVTAALTSIGIERGSMVLVHADAIVAAQFPAVHPAMADDERLDLLIGAIEAAIGTDGTLVIPAFSYSFTKGEVFDVLRTPSAVGMVSERFRIQQGVCRTSDPIFSFACRGRLASELCALPVNECFGAESVFGFLHRRNAHIVDLGCSMSRGGTFVHYVETAHGVDYRYRKEFSGTVIYPSGQRAEHSVVYNVRDLTRRSDADLRRLQRRLADDGKSRTANLGRSRVMAVTAGDLFATAWRMLDEDPVALIAEGSRE
ncbi:MAG: AAC(3) family N-acetyltransferase [Terriglobales bacterium]|jgi:aminoglycoside 3-N-acetyltransferase